MFSTFIVEGKEAEVKDREFPKHRKSVQTQMAQND